MLIPSKVVVGFGGMCSVVCGLGMLHELHVGQDSLHNSERDSRKLLTSSLNAESEIWVDVIEDTHDFSD